MRRLLVIVSAFAAIVCIEKPAEAPELLETRNVPTETLRPAVPDAHQPSCFGLEEERGANWKGSGGAAPSIKEGKPSL